MGSGGSDDGPGGVMSRRKRAIRDWTAEYPAARAKAQSKANETGFDFGLECNPHFGWRSFMLPMKQNRCGHELQCEVVMCENINACQPGHGPTGQRGKDAW
jgi:hypothetical protein